MYAVIRYFNYRKDITFNILKTFNNVERAKKYAFQCAEEDYGDAVIEGVSDQYVYIDDETFPGFTKGDGGDKFVYTVISLPEPEDDDSQDESNTNNFEYGFDSTDFSEEYDQMSGVLKFQELLDEFDLKLVNKSRGFQWKNADMTLVTANNPLTGEYYDGSQCDRGMLGYVGITCNSKNLLERFISEFKSHATYIKDESDRREFI